MTGRPKGGGLKGAANPHGIRWFRLKGESRKAYEAFAVYRDLGAARSQAKAAERLGKSLELMKRWSAKHHPFTRPSDEWKERFTIEPKQALAHAYDLVVNGNELGGGSFRVHEPKLQAQVFDLLQLSPDEQRTKFGFLLDALAMGAPPMGGIAFGIDRMTMVLAGEPNLRDVIAFPKNQAGFDPMSGAPSEVGEEQLDELGIRIAVPEPLRPPAGS